MFYIWIAVFLLLPVFFHYRKTIRHELTPGEPRPQTILKRFLAHREFSLGLFTYYYFVALFYSLSATDSLVEGFNMVHQTDVAQSLSEERIWTTLILLVLLGVLFVRIPAMRRWSKYIVLLLLLGKIVYHMDLASQLHKEFGSHYESMTQIYQQVYDVQLLDAIWARRVSIVMYALATFFWLRLPESSYETGPAAVYLKGRQLL